MTIPTFDEMAQSMHTVSLPLVIPFRRLEYREILLCEGPDGLAEWSPFPEYDDVEASHWLRCTLEQGWNQSSLAPLEPHSPTIGVNGTLPVMPATEVAGFVEALGHPLTLKIKVGGPGTTLRDDVERVAAARKALGVAGRIRLDANGAWTLDEAEHAIRAMEHLDLDYVEQPVESLGDMAELRRRIARLGIQVAADESIRRWSDIEQVLAHEACDLVVLKVQPLGGIARALEIAAQARAHGVEVVVSSALESSVGIFYAARLQQLLAAHSDVVHDAGLGTVSLFVADVVTTPLVAHAGILPLTEPTLDAAMLARYAMPGDRQEWWQERLRRCLALL